MTGHLLALPRQPQQLLLRRLRLGAGRPRFGPLRDLLAEAPEAREEAVDALDALVGPVAAALGRSHEADVGAGGVGAVALDVVAGADGVALRLRHLRPVAGDHPLG